MEYDLRRDFYWSRFTRRFATSAREPWSRYNSPTFRSRAIYYGRLLCIPVVEVREPFVFIMRIVTIDVANVERESEKYRKLVFIGYAYTRRGAFPLSCPFFLPLSNQTSFIYPCGHLFAAYSILLTYPRHFSAATYV